MLNSLISQPVPAVSNTSNVAVASISESQADCGEMAGKESSYQEAGDPEAVRSKFVSWTTYW